MEVRLARWAARTRTPINRPTSTMGGMASAATTVSAGLRTTMAATTAAKGDDLGRDRHEPSRHQFLHRVEIGGAPADRVSDGVLVVVLDRKRADMAEQPDPQRVQHALGGGDRLVTVEEPEGRPPGRRGEEHERGAAHALGVAGDELVIDEVAEHERGDELLKCRGRQHRAGDHRQAGPVRTEQPGQVRPRPPMGTVAGPRAFGHRPSWARYIRA